MTNCYVKGIITLKESANLFSINIQGMFVHNESTISSSDTIPDGMTVKKGTLTVNKNFTDTVIDLNENWTNNVKKFNLLSLSQSLSIIGKDISNYIKGDRGTDTITSGEFKDTIYGRNFYENLRLRKCACRNE